MGCKESRFKNQKNVGVHCGFAPYWLCVRGKLLPISGPSSSHLCELEPQPGHGNNLSGAICSSLDVFSHRQQKPLSTGFNGTETRGPMCCVDFWVGWVGGRMTNRSASSTAPVASAHLCTVRGAGFLLRPSAMPAAFVLITAGPRRGSLPSGGCPGQQRTSLTATSSLSTGQRWVTCPSSPLPPPARE